MVIRISQQVPSIQSPSETSQATDVGDAAQPVSSEGFSTADSVEQFLSHSPLGVGNDVGSSAPPAISTVDVGGAISPFGQATSSPDLQSTLNDIANFGPGQINWDVVLLIKEQALKKPPDVNAMMNSLQALNPDDRAQTLAELSKDGGLASLLQAVGGSSQKFMQFLDMMGADSNSEPKTKAVLEQVLKTMDDGTGANAAIAKEFAYQGWNLSSTAVDNILHILNDDPVADSRLSDLIAMKQLRQNHPATVADEFIAWGEHTDPLDSSSIQFKIDDYISDYINGNVNLAPPIMADDLLLGGTDGLSRLSQQGRLAPLISKMLTQGENVAPCLQTLIGPDETDPQSQQLIREILQVVQNEGGAAADDTVRDMLTGLGRRDIPDALGKLSPDLLITMKLILETGDDNELNRAAISNVIDPAFNTAKS